MNKSVGEIGRKRKKEEGRDIDKVNIELRVNGR